MAEDMTNLSPEYMAESKSTTIQAALWTAASVPLVFVILRCTTRVWLRKVFGLDDALIVAAMALLIAYVAIVTAAVQKGLGRHIEVVMQNPQDVVDVGRLGQVCQPFVIMSCALGKTSFAVTLMRVAAQRWVHITLWFIIVTMNLLHILISIVLFARCKDPRHLWDLSIPSKCWSPTAFLQFSLFIGAYSAATDFVLALLPWAMLWDLQMRKREKFGVAIAMSLGVFAGSIAIIKATHLIANSTDQDVTFVVGELLWWAGTENGLIILAACVPTLRPLLRKIFPTSSAGKSNENSNSVPLKTIGGSFNMFVPKQKQGHWSAIAEAEIGQDHASDDQSERSILKQHHDGRNNDEGTGSGRLGERLQGRAGQIKMTRQIDVSYSERNPIHLK